MYEFSDWGPWLRPRHIATGPMLWLMTHEVARIPHQVTDNNVDNCNISVSRMDSIKAPSAGPGKARPPNGFW